MARLSSETASATGSFAARAAATPSGADREPGLGLRRGPRGEPRCAGRPGEQHRVAEPARDGEAGLDEGRSLGGRATGRSRARPRARAGASRASRESLSGSTAQRPAEVVDGVLAGPPATSAAPRRSSAKAPPRRGPRGRATRVSGREPSPPRRVDDGGQCAAYAASRASSSSRSQRSSSLAPGTRRWAATASARRPWRRGRRLPRGPGSRRRPRRARPARRGWARSRASAGRALPSARRHRAWPGTTGSVASAWAIWACTRARRRWWDGEVDGVAGQGVGERVPVVLVVDEQACSAGRLEQLVHRVRVVLIGGGDRLDAERRPTTAAVPRARTVSAGSAATRAVTTSRTVAGTTAASSTTGAGTVVRRPAAACRRRRAVSRASSSR